MFDNLEKTDKIQFFINSVKCHLKMLSIKYLIDHLVNILLLQFKGARVCSLNFELKRSTYTKIIKINLPKCCQNRFTLVHVHCVVVNFSMFINNTHVCIDVC